MYFNLEKHKQ